MEFIESINILIKENKLKFVPCEPLLYTGDGVIFDFLMALLHKHSKAEFSPIHSNLSDNLGVRST